MAKLPLCAERRRPVFIFDTETTGLSPARESMVEIAVCELSVTAPRREETILSFSSLMRPRNAPKEGPRSAARIHGITNKMLQDAPHFRAVWKELEEFIKHASRGRGRPILVAHNLPFDLRFIREELRRIGETLPPWDFADSLRDVSHLIWPGEKCSLAALVDRLGVVNEEAHRALCDVKATCKILEAVDEKLAEDAIQQNPTIATQVRSGDFIYDMLCRAADKHRPEVAPFWRSTDLYFEGSIADSVTEMSTSEVLHFGAMSIASSPSSSVDTGKDPNAVFEAPGGCVYHTTRICTALRYSPNYRATRASSRKKCRLCKAYDVNRTVTDESHSHTPIRPQPSTQSRPKFQNASGHGHISDTLLRSQENLQNEKNLQDADNREIRRSPRLAKQSSEDVEMDLDTTLFDTLAEPPNAVSRTNLPRLYYFTDSGICYHAEPTCYGLRTAAAVRKRNTPIQGQRACQVCCEDR